MVIHFALAEIKKDGLILYACAMTLAMLIMGRFKDPLLYGHVFAIIIVAFEACSDYLNRLPSLIKKIISILGAYSYCIYLIHPIVIAFIKNVFEEWYDNIGTRLEIAIGYIVGTAGIAWVCHNVIEKIGRKREGDLR